MRLWLPLSLCLLCLTLLGARTTSPAPPTSPGPLSALLSQQVAAPPMALRSLQSGGITRYFRVHEPVGYNSNVAVPIVLAFHGGGGNARQFADQSEMYVSADNHDYLLVFPEGTGMLGGPPFFRLETWNAGNCCGYAQTNDIDDVQFVRDMVVALAAEWNVDLQHVYATGHSNGGMMAYRLGMEAADLITAIAPNSAALGLAGLPAAPIPVMALHGRLDTNVPFQGGVGSGPSGTDYRSQRQSLVPFARANGVSSYALAETRGQALRFEGPSAAGFPLHYWYLRDGGHSWPGHGSALGDSVNMDIDANEEIWAFFSQF